VFVLEDEGAVLVGGEELGGAVGTEVGAGAVVLGDAIHAVLGADGEDELEVLAVEGVGGGDEGEAAGEAEAHDADGAAGLRGEPLGGLADGADGGLIDVVVLDIRQLRGEDADAATGHGGGEAFEAGLVDAEMMDAVEDDEGGGVGFVFREVEAAADLSGFEGEREVLDGDGLGDELADN
jgi:hypothetical protein